jgi:hypothetical protein
MLDDLLANEVGNALDNPAGYVYPFASLSPDAQGNVVNLPSSGSPTADPITLAQQHRNSFSAQGAPNLAHRDSLSFPPPGSQRNSFSAPGEGMPIPATNSLPGDGITKGVGFDRLPNFDTITMSHGQETNGHGHTRSGSFGNSVAEVHRKFLDSMKSLDEREVEIAGLDGIPPTGNGTGAPIGGGGGGGRLEMLLGEMVDDGDGDGVFGGVSTMGVLGPMSGLSPTSTFSMAGMGYGSSGLGIGGGGLNMAGMGVGAMGMSLSGAPSPSPLNFGPGVGFSGDFSW